jgi:hypothetical protein
MYIDINVSYRPRYDVKSIFYLPFANPDAIYSMFEEHQKVSPVARFFYYLKLT